MIKLLDEKSRSWKGLNMVTENEMKEKLKKLQEAKSLQEEKTKAANEALTKAKNRCSKENAKLDSINGEINRIDGYLFRKVTLKYGIKNHNELEEYLQKHKIDSNIDKEESDMEMNAEENKGELNK